MRETMRRCVRSVLLALATLTAQARVVRIAVTEVTAEVLWEVGNNFRLGAKLIF